MQCATACCSVLQCAAVCCSVLQCSCVSPTIILRWWYEVLHCSVPQRVAVWCSVLQCVAVCSRVLHLALPFFNDHANFRSVRVCMYVHMCVCWCVCACMCICFRGLCECACTYVHVYACGCLCAGVCIFISIHMCSYIHTQPHYKLIYIQIRALWFEWVCVCVTYESCHTRSCTATDATQRAATDHATRCCNKHRNKHCKKCRNRYCNNRRNRCCNNAPTDAATSTLPATHDVAANADAAAVWFSFTRGHAKAGVCTCIYSIYVYIYI